MKRRRSSGPAIDGRSSAAGPSDPAPPTRVRRGRRAMSRSVVAMGAALGLLVLIYAGALYTLRPASPGRMVFLDALVRDAGAGQVRSARFLDEDSRVVGRLNATDGGPSVRYWTAYPRSDAATNDLLKTLLGGGAQVSVDSQSSKALVRFVAQFLLPLVILADLFALLFSLIRVPGGAGSELVTFSRIGNRQVSSGPVVTTFADVAAEAETVAELSELRDYLSRPDAYVAMGALAPKGVLIVGPPGCGKTLLARAVAGESQAAFFSVSGSEFVESLVGVGAARVRDLFSQARAMPPAIIFIDELDAVGRQRGAGLGGGHDEREQTLNELLVQMDGFAPTDGVLVLAATNRPDILDPALLRPGRFDRRITIERPDLDGRTSILRLHAKRKRLVDSEADLPHVARRTPGFSGADLASVLNEAAFLAVRERTSAIGRSHLEEAVERVLGGPRRRAHILTPSEKRRIAYHEAGHAVVAASVGRIDAVSKLSVISRGRGIGHTAVAGDDGLVPTRSSMEAQVAIAMAGIAAEEMACGEPSAGAEADLEKATATARDMAGRFGMSDRLGRARVLRPQREIFLGRDYLLAGDVSQPTMEHLDAEVRRILDEQEARARAILDRQRPVLDRLAEVLVSQETLQGTELHAVLSTVQGEGQISPSRQ